MQFILADGQPMPGYDLAKAEIEQRGGQIQTASGGGFFAWLSGIFGGGSDDAEEAAAQEVGGRCSKRARQSFWRRAGRARGPAVEIASWSGRGGESQARHLPTGPAFAGPAPAAPRPARAGLMGPRPPPGPALDQPEAKPQVVAALHQRQVESDAALDSPVKLTGPIARSLSCAAAAAAAALSRAAGRPARRHSPAPYLGPPTSSPRRSLKGARL